MWYISRCHTSCHTALNEHTYTPGELTPALRSLITEQVRLALEEDIGTGDLSVSAMPDTEATAAVISRTAGVLAGTFWFNEVYTQINPDISVSWKLNDGDLIMPEKTLCQVHGNGKHILTGERCALNFVQTLSATASVAREFAERSRGRVKIMDTRKTIPGLRAAQKYAAACGGAHNHRQGLFDGILIKENHLHIYGSIAAAVKQTRTAHPDMPIELEVENLHQVEEALAAQADTILLDNFSLDDIRQAVALIGDRAETEVSGGVTLDNLEELINSGVTRISVGALTKHIQALDLSMRLV